MSYCSRCGVEVHDLAVNCPLCQSPIQKFADSPHSGRTFPEDELVSSRPPRMNRKERLQLASVLTGFGMLIPVLISMSVDLTINTALSWSKYPLIILSACLLLVLTALYCARKPKLLMWLSFLIICTLMICLNRFTSFPAIAVKRGIPVALFAVLCSHFVVYTSTKSKRKGSNIAAFILISTGIFCLLTDLFLNYSLNGTLRVSWSLIVLAATQPVSMILLYLHYRDDRNSKLKKYFHI